MLPDEDRFCASLHTAVKLFARVYIKSMPILLSASAIFIKLKTLLIK